MLELFRAEWQKNTGNRWASGFLIWAFPAGAFGVIVVMILIALFASPSVQEAAGIASLESHSAQWTTTMIQTLNLANMSGGRLIILSFAAIMFAGEYQWGTWKNLLQHRARVPLILIKFITLSVFVITAFATAAIIAAIGMGIAVAIKSGTYGPALTAETFKTFLPDLALQAFNTFASTLIAASYAALAAMITRSILASVLFSLGFLTIEMGSFGLFSLLSFLLDNPMIVTLYRWTPSYNISNIVTTLNGEPPTYPILAEWGAENSLTLSAVVLFFWVAGLVTLTTLLFQKRDITV